MTLLLLLLHPLLFGAIAYAVARSVTGHSIAWARRGNLLAEVNERSSHSVPTPRVGGIGVVVALVPLCVVALATVVGFQRLAGFEPDGVDWLPATGLLACTAGAFLLGLWDDRGDPPAVLKLAGQVIIAAAAPAFGLVVRELDLPFAGRFQVPFWAGAALAFAAMLALMNAVNFMDGINGLAGRFGMAFGCCMIAWTLNAGWRIEFPVLGAIALGAYMGFLRWNLGPQARTFMGDCGSQSLGAFAATAMLLLHNNHGASPVPTRDSLVGMALVAAPLVYDVAVTLGRRAMRGENLMRAHREHLYQRYLAARGEDHREALAHFETPLLLGAACSFFYVRPLFGPPDVVRLLALAITAGGLYYYHKATLQAESAAASGRPVG